MTNIITDRSKRDIAEKGFSIIPDVFSVEELTTIQNLLNNTDTSSPSFRKTADLFAIRRFFKEVPAAENILLTDKFVSLIEQIFGSGYFLVKSIYFDKPGTSNWFVSYHQDLTISVDKKEEIKGFGPWTVKQDQFAVQPPVEILENIFTIRIHLDDTNKDNGALRVIPGSHRKGIYRPEIINWNTETEISCSVPAGGIMIMKPLLLHASNRTANQSRRRVVHLEFSDRELPSSLKWAERIRLKAISSA
jgi:ectoine hydroxylase-related dioxygenase (phytanoyl-CoA dioxygenase family)